MTSFGGTQAETNTDLCPWVFGSTALMNAAGQELVNKGVIGLVRAETGGVTIPGLPGIASLGAALSTGPNLTSINTSFGSSGITTNYEFRTYTPKLGNLSRAFIDRIKRIAKNRQENIKLLRANMINQIKINRKIRQVNRAAIAAMAANPQAQPRNEQAAVSMNRVMVGEMYNWESKEDGGSTQRTVVGTSTLSKSVVDMRYDYAQKCFVSFDAIFAPASINGASNALPRFITPYSGSDLLHHVSPIHAQPPIATGICNDPPVPTSHDEYNLEIHNLYLNPLANPGAIPHYTSSSTSPGHSIDMVGRENAVPSSGLIGNFYDPKDPAKYSDDYRFLGMKGPIVLHSWGYDVDGKPIPNNIDNETDTRQGKFKTSDGAGGGLKDQFMKDWLQKPATWPVGPIDLRFDRERGVWVSPQPFKIVTARIIKEVDRCGEGVGLVINKGLKRYGRQLYDGDGKEIVENSDCQQTDICGFETPPPDPCSKWILTSVGRCAEDDGCDFDLQLYLQNNKLVLDYTCNGITKSTFVQTIDCLSSSTSSQSSSSSSSSNNIASSSSSSSNITNPGSSSSTSSDSSNLPLIRIVDRIGIKHKIGDMVYAYYDTFANEYLVIESINSVTDNVIVYGYLTSNTQLSVNGYSGNNGRISLGDIITFENPLNLRIPTGCVSPIYAILSKVYTC
ncbi:hypothetical protein EB001_17675 [bacterium]|nr:hypothetical protein [bacterium]